MPGPEAQPREKGRLIFSPHLTSPAMGPGVKRGELPFPKLDEEGRWARGSSGLNTNWIIHTKLHIYGFSGKGRGMKKEERKGRRELELAFLCGNHFSRRDTRLPGCPLAHWHLMSPPRRYRLSEFVSSALHHTSGILVYHPLPSPSEQGSSDRASVVLPALQSHVKVRLSRAGGNSLRWPSRVTSVFLCRLRFLFFFF